MDTQISTPVKIFALAALVLGLGMGAMMMLKGGGDSGAIAEPVTPVVHPTPTPAATTPAVTPAATTPATPAAPARPSTAPATAKPVHAAKPVHVAKPVHAKPAHPARPAAHAATPAPAVKPKATVKPKVLHLPPVAENGLPRALDELLHIHRVVVVAVYDAEISTDRLFVGEARAGALDAHAGFVAVNVLDEKVAAPLTASAGKGALLPSPGLLIYKQPTVLMNVITGFIDRAAVANAVANALVADAPAGGTATTATP